MSCHTIAFENQCQPWKIIWFFYINNKEYPADFYKTHVKPRMDASHEANDILVERV